MKVVLKLKFLGLPEPSHFAGLWWASELVGRAGTRGVSNIKPFNCARQWGIVFYLAISIFLGTTSTICIPYSCSGYRRCDCRGCMILSPLLSEDGIFTMIFSKAATIGAYRKSGGENDGIWDVFQAAILKTMVPVWDHSLSCWGKYSNHQSYFSVNHFKP